MQAKTHEFTGIAMALMAAAITVTPEVNAITYTSTLVAGAAFGSLLPDIDHKGSKISKEHKIISKLVSDGFKHRGLTHSLLANLVVASVCIGLSVLFESFYNDGLLGKLFLSLLMTSVFHLFYLRYEKLRNVVKSFLDANGRIIHALVFIFVYFTANFFVQYVFYISIGIVIGYFSHLIADAFTVSGVAFFQPFSKKSIRFAKFKTGENEGLFRGIVGAVTAVVVVIGFIL